MKQAFLILGLVVASAAGLAYHASDSTATDSASGFQTAAVDRGDLVSSISATGTLEPEEVVDVGAQVMGSILELGPDPHDPTKLIDYGSVVEKGTVLARIDPTLYEAAQIQAEATLERSRAELLQLEAKFQQTEKTWSRTQRLRSAKTISENEHDTALAEYSIAKANLDVGKAAIRQNEAALSTAKYNLGYTTIKSPIAGTIIDRRVNIGQTVVASLNAPSLFLIAKDLKRMQVWASVNEADIGRIRPGMPARFTVDAYPGETFRGEVSQIRLNATMTQNIVTYTVIITTENPSGRLLPYLTANVQFEAERRTNVLRVPNAALRWQPPANRIDSTADRSLVSSAEPTGDQGVVWIPTEAGFVRPVKVSIGMSDGTMTEVRGEVTEGMKIVAGELLDAGGAESGGEARNPFLPKPPKGPPPGGGM